MSFGPLCRGRKGQRAGQETGQIDTEERDKGETPRQPMYPRT